MGTEGAASDPAGRIIDLYPGASDTPMMGYVAPVYGVQSDPGEEPQIGYLLGNEACRRGVRCLLVEGGESLVERSPRRRVTA